MQGTALTITGFLGKEQCHTKTLCQKGIVMTLKSHKHIVTPYPLWKKHIKDRICPFTQWIANVTKEHCTYHCSLIVSREPQQ